MSKDAPDSPYTPDHKSKRKDKWHRKKANEWHPANEIDEAFYPGEYAEHFEAIEKGAKP